MYNWFYKLLVCKIKLEFGCFESGEIWYKCWLIFLLIDNKKKFVK